MDTESPVVWPAWCYSGEPPSYSADAVEPHGTLSRSSPVSVTHSILSSTATNVAHDHSNFSSRAKRLKRHNHSHHHAAAHLIQSGRHQQPNVTPKTASTCPESIGSSDFGGTTTGGGCVSNNNVGEKPITPPIKSERLSPLSGSGGGGGSGGVCGGGTNSDGSSRSRSLTPANTPPALDRLTSNNHFALTYSDFMRNLAAKYNTPNMSASAVDTYFTASSLAFAKMAYSQPLHRPGGTVPSSGGTGINNIRAATVSPEWETRSLFASDFPRLSLLHSHQGVTEKSVSTWLRHLLALLKQCNKDVDVSAMSETAITPLDLSQNSTAQPERKPPGKISQRSGTLMNNSNSQQQRPSHRSPLSVDPVTTTSSSTSSSPVQGACSVSNIAVSKTEPSTTASPSQHPQALSVQGDGTICTGTTTTNNILPQYLLQRHTSYCNDKPLDMWTVADVCDFVGSIDICAEYVPAFREQQIDGSGLPLLTEEHLTKTMQLKLGPALKLRSIIDKMLNVKAHHCAECTHHRNGFRTKLEPFRSDVVVPSPAIPSTHCNITAKNETDFKN